MPNPQREAGHLDVANELAEAFARLRLNSTQSCILWVVLRKTYGWNKSMDTISVAQFAEATGIAKEIIKRELRRMIERNILRAWGDDHHPKQYGIQKDYSRWEDDRSDRSPKVGTKTSPPARPKVGTKTSQSGDQNVSQVGTKTLPTITKKATTTKTTTDSHESAASGTLFQRYERKYREATNKIAVLGELFSLLLGDAPNYQRIGSMAKRLNSGGKLIRLIIDASQQTISDNPHDYLDKLVTGELAKETGDAITQGRHRQNGRGAGRRDRRLAMGAAGSHGPGGHDSWSEGE